MLNMAEDRCPHCEKKIFVISKIGGEVVMTTVVDNWTYRSLVMLDKHIKKEDWKITKSYEKVGEVIDKLLIPKLALNLRGRSREFEEV